MSYRSFLHSWKVWGQMPFPKISKCHYYYLARNVTQSWKILLLSIVPGTSELPTGRISHPISLYNRNLYVNKASQPSSSSQLKSSPIDGTITTKTYAFYAALSCALYGKKGHTAQRLYINLNSSNCGLPDNNKNFISRKRFKRKRELKWKNKIRQNCSYIRIWNDWQSKLSVFKFIQPFHWIFFLLWFWK